MNLKAETNIPSSSLRSAIPHSESSHTKAVTLGYYPSSKQAYKAATILKKKNSSDKRT